MGLFNRMAMDASAGNPVINRAVQAALENAKALIEDYLPPAFNDDRRDQMPHEWGSLDTYDDCRNAIGIAKDIMDGVLDAYEDEEAQCEFVRRAIKDHSICAVSDELKAVAFPQRTEQEDARLTQLEEILAQHAGDPPETMTLVGSLRDLDTLRETLRAKHWTEQTIEDYLYLDGTEGSEQ